MSTPSPVALAEDLLREVKAIYGADGAAASHDTYEAKKRVQLLADRLKRDVLGPLEYTVLLAEAAQESAALRLVAELGVADAIGDDTKTLAELAAHAGVAPRFLGIAMSCLVALGFFDEVGGFGARTYRNNAFSDVLRADGDPTVKDAVGFVADDGLKAAGYLLEAAKAAGVGALDRRAKPALNLAFGFEESVFEWFASPAQAWRGQRMGRAMQQLHRMANGHVVDDFDWPALASPVVDVGGGIGALEMALMKAYPDTAPEFVIFDIPQTSANAQKIWAAQPPAARARVSFAAGDFLAPSLAETGLPCGHPTYLIRHVLHDWTDDQVVAILRAVRGAMLAPGGAAAPTLLLCEMLLQATSARFVHTTSLQLLALNNGATRTEDEMRALVGRAGFRVVRVHAMRAVDSIIEAVPLAA
ncbi:hypothetical protein PHLGIDRAFT_130017 [Phlebiopsis gigantea 11061_1 CR5-6]|uniref:Uncharacterized protein n=1 Tax=Phlebiopsis gigantea (strain 11061_1 CR5-6) TaxID=745531 RepID=A0A0C3PE25_PHLG1|nr:hypothetical protein PHLGIDRAFT_130017 [Phlebiopsis gigantea 11061_1 CR5-6]